MRAIATLALLGAIGCQSGTVSVFFDHAPSVVEMETVEEAAAVLGLTVELSSTPWGAIRVEIYDGEYVDGEYFAGMALEGARACDEHWVRSIPDPLVLAHELGHALGLSHTDEIGNGMYPTDPIGWEYSDEQLDVVAKHAASLERRCF